MSSDEPAAPTDRELTELVDAERAAAAARERGRGRWLRTQAVETARLDALLLDAAERQRPVTIRTTAGRRHTGRVIAVGVDFCGVATATGAEIYLRTGAVTVVTPDPAASRTDPADDRRGPLDLTLAELLAQEAPERPRVALVCAGDPEPVVGLLRAVGEDVVTVATDAAGLAHVAVASLTEVVFLPQN